MSAEILTTFGIQSRLQFYQLIANLCKRAIPTANYCPFEFYRNHAVSFAAKNEKAKSCENNDVS